MSEAAVVEKPARKRREMTEMDEKSLATAKRLELKVKEHPMEGECAMRGCSKRIHAQRSLWCAEDLKKVRRAVNADCGKRRYRAAAKAKKAATKKAAA